MMTKRGVEDKSEKIEIIQQMQSPRNLCEVQRLVGRIIALSRFISRSTDRSLLFFKILRRATQFQWNAKYNKAFLELKDYLSELSILAKPYPGEELWIYLAILDIVVALY